MTSIFNDEFKKRKKDKKASGSVQKKQQKPKNEVSDYYFCENPRHVKRVYTKFHAWNVKKSTFSTLICFETILVSIPRHTW